MLDSTNATEGDIVYYNVMAIRLEKKDIKDYDSLLNMCENYYTKTNNKSLLSEIYMKKALHLFRDKDIYDSAAVLLNESEKLAFETKDYYMLSQIYWLKSAFHEYERNKNKVKEDVNLQLYYAELSKNQRQIAYATLNKAIAYKNMNMKDSAKILLHAALLLSNNIKPSDLAHIYNALGELTDAKDSILAKDNFMKSLEIYPNIPAKLNLAKIYLNEKNISRTQELCNEGLQYKWPETKIEFLKLLCQCEESKGNLKEVINIQEKILSEKDSVLKYIENGNKLRQSFHLANNAVASESAPYWKYVSILCVLLCVGFAIIISTRYKKQNNKLTAALTQNSEQQRTLQNILLNNKSLQELSHSQEKEIARIKQENLEQSQHIALLEQKLNTEIQKNINLKNTGEMFYNQIVDNKAISTWTTDDMVNFVEYYRTINPELVESFDNDYKKLTPRYKIILILEDLGKSIEDIKQIMSFEETSYYSAKSRINGQRKSLH
ncbi:MAG: hypothetical protein IKP73_08725 [Bacteroidales bacterium]|nr:hypothetical protein [Bacteroidales bacterium]